VQVYAVLEHGMATVWDADVLIWAASLILTAQDRGLPTSRFFRFTPCQLLIAVGRATGSREYQLLKGALTRLQSTVIRPTIRHGEHWRRQQFSWVNEWEELTTRSATNAKGGVSNSGISMRRARAWRGSPTSCLISDASSRVSCCRAMRLPLNTMTIAASPWSCGQTFPQELWESCGFHQAISGLRAHGSPSSLCTDSKSPTLKDSKAESNLLLFRASVVGRDTMKRPPIEETSHDRLAPQSRVRRRPDDSRIAFAGVRAYQSRPLTVIAADGTAPRGSGQASVRMLGYQAASLRRTYGRLTPATTELTSNSKAHLSAARPNDQHPAGTARPHQERPARHGIATAGAPHDLAQAHAPL